jgi:hypothetical protein
MGFLRLGGLEREDQARKAEKGHTSPREPMANIFGGGSHSSHYDVFPTEDRTLFNTLIF